MISNQCELTFHVPSPKTGIVNPLFSFTFGTLTILHDSRDWLNSSRWHLSSLMNFTQATNEVCVSHDEFLFHDSANTVQPAIVREYKQFSQTTTNSNRSHETATRERKKSKHKIESKSEPQSITELSHLSTRTWRSVKSVQVGCCCFPLLHQTDDAEAEIN